MRTLKWSICSLALTSLLWAAATAAGQATAPADKAPPAAVPDAAPPPATLLDKAPQGAPLLAIVKDVSALDGKLGDLVAQLMPQGEGGAAAPKMEPLKMLMAQMSGKPDLLKAGSPLVFLLTLDPADDDEPLMAMLVDVADFKGFVGEAQADADGIYEFALNGHTACAPYQGLVLISDNKAAIQAFMKMPAGVKLTAAQDELWKNADAFALVNLAQLVKTSTPDFERSRAGMVKAAAEAQAALDAEAAKEAPDAKARDQAAKALDAAKATVQVMDDLWAYASQADWLVLGASADKDGVDVKLALAVKPGSKLASYLAGHPPLAKDLAPSLPAMDAWVAGWYSFEPQKVSAALTDLFGLLRTAVQLIPANAAEPQGFTPAKLADLLKQVEDLAKAQMDTVGGQGAAAGLFDKNGSIVRSVTVMKAQDPAAFRKNTEALAKASKGFLASMMELAPTGGPKIEMDLTYEKDVQKLGDLSLDRSVFKIKLPAAAKKPEADGAAKSDGAAEGADKSPPATDPAAAMTKAMTAFWGGDTVTTWFAFSDGYVFSEVGPAPEHLAELIKTVKAGGGLADDPNLAALRRHTLADANVVAFVSLSSYMNALAGVMMASQGQQGPPPNPVLAQVKSALSLAAGQDRLVYELYVPVGEMRMIMINFMMLKQMQQAQVHGQAPPQEPQEQPKKTDEKEGAGADAI